MPQAFGSFAGNLTLVDSVCGSCNQEFGDTIDFVLARGSAEAVHRFDYGVASPKKARNLRRDRLRFVWPGPGDWTGAIMQLVAEAGEVVVDLVPQVGFPKLGSAGYVFVAEEELQDVGSPLPHGVDPKQPLMVVSNSSEVTARIAALLEARGHPFTPASVRPNPIGSSGGMVPVEITAKVDAQVFRCIAKIAFNYLVHVMGAEFALQRDFSVVRRYIRYGDRPPYPLVAVDSNPILKDDLPRFRQTNGHLITVGWASDGVSIMGQVSLFNEARYRVSLARNYRGLWVPISSGHHFDIDSQQVQPLVSSSRYLPVFEPTP